MSVMVAGQDPPRDASRHATMQLQHAIAASAALVAAASALPSPAAADPSDPSRELVLRTFAIGEARVPSIPRCARGTVVLGLEVTPLDADRLDWLSPLFVWIEPGYAFAALTLVR
jgi:hypothetical protein